MSEYKNASFPPHGPWDQRLSEIACPSLRPIKMLHENPWFSVYDRGGYFTIEYHLQQVVVLPVVNGHSVVMVRVKRPVIDDMTLELPAGAVESGESPHAAAARELAEETGIVIPDTDRYVPMPPLAGFPSRMPTLSFVFRVDLSEQSFATRLGHDDEIHSVELIPLQRLPKMMSSGEIYVAVPLAVLGIFLSACERVV